MLKFSISTLVIVAAGLAPAPATAQEGGEDVIVVTGSFIKRQSQANLPSPLDTVGSEQIDGIGAKNIADITRTLTINTGAENVSDAFTQNATTGTESINLRGLGLSSTLVLLNGKRQVLTAVQNNEGVQFVDTASLVPLIAIDRIEILKDGASALYGSDAVAGVVNFITKENFNGVQLSGDFQALTGEGDQREFNVQGLWGLTTDRADIVAAVAYKNQTALDTLERRFSRPQDDSSALGLPGSFFGVPGLPAGTPVIDPTGCAEVGGIPDVIIPNVAMTGLDVGLCGFDFGDYYTLVPDQTRVNGFFRVKYDITDWLQWTNEFGYARNRATRNNSASFPNLTLPTVPASNPFNPFGFDVQFFGRAIGNGVNGSFEPPKVNEFEQDTWRYSTTFSGDFGESASWNISFTHAQNDAVVKTEDLVAQRYQNALNGLGGAGCDPFTGTPGVDPCQYLNPFASALNGLAPPNDPALIESLFEFQDRDSTSKITVVEGYVSFDAFELPAGPVGVALGGQYRLNELSTRFDPLSEADAFAFLVGDQAFGGDQDTYAFFGEIAAPLTSFADLQVAVRYEDYGEGIGDTVDPKVALLVRPTETLSLRGSYSTSFRAPSIFQQVGQGTSLNQVVDPVTGGQFFAAVRGVGNPGLENENSRAFNFGATWEPVDGLLNGLSVNIDYWNFSFENLIVQESFQALLNAFPTDTRASLQDPCTIETTRVCRVGDLAAGPVLQINNTFANASSLDTSGLDFRIAKLWDTQIGSFQPFFEGTYILEYDLVDPQAGPIEGAGRRNFTNIGTSAPELRFNTGFLWSYGPHSANLFVRRISSYEDDQNPGIDVDAWTTLDMQYALNLSELMDTEKNVALTVGAINVTDEDPPQVFTNLGFDTKVHDPRGRSVYVRLDLGF